MSFVSGLPRPPFSEEDWDTLSSFMLRGCRDIDDLLQPKGGWKGWSTSGMRILTDSLLEEVYWKMKELKEVEEEEDLTL